MSVANTHISQIIESTLDNPNSDLIEEFKDYPSIIFKTHVLNKSKFSEYVDTITSFIKLHEERIDPIIRESLDKNKKISIEFVNHKSLPSCAQWSGTVQTIFIAIDFNEHKLDESFLFELLNSINPNIIEFNYAKILNNPSEKLGEELIQISEKFSVDQDTKEFWTSQKFNEFLGLTHSSLAAYLEEQQNESPQYHGFSHTGQYQYKALKGIHNHLEILIKLKTLELHPNNLGKQIQIISNSSTNVQVNDQVIELQTNELKNLNKAYEGITAYIANMEEEAKFALAVIEFDKRNFIELENKTKHIDIRMQLLYESADLNRPTVVSPEAANLLNSFNMRKHENFSHLTETQRAAIGAYSTFQIYNTKFSLDEDEALLQKVRTLPNKLKNTN